MIPALTENLCEVKKIRSLWGTSNSHNPQLTWTSAQSEAALKVRGDASTYINHEGSHHKKSSNAHKLHSACQCVSIFLLFSVFPHKGIHQIFLLGFLFRCFMIHLFCLHVCSRLCSTGGSTGLCVELFLSTYHLSVVVQWVIPLPREASHCHQSMGDHLEKGLTSKINPKFPYLL